MGKYHGRIAADVILGRDARLDERAGGPLSPRVVFTDPQVAAVGHTLESALAAGIDARAVDQETSGTAGGSFYGRGAPGHVAPRRRRGPARDRRRDVRRRRRLGVRPRRDDRDRRRGDRSTASGTRRRRSRRAARSGFACSRRTGCERRTRPPGRGAAGPRAVAALGPVPERARLGDRARGLQRRAATRGTRSRTTTPARAPTAGARTGSRGSATTARCSASRSRSGTAATRS